MLVTAFRARRITKSASVWPCKALRGLRSHTMPDAPGMDASGMAPIRFASAPTSGRYGHSANHLQC